MKKNILLLLLFLLPILAPAQDFKFALVTDTHVRDYDSLAYNDLLKSIDQINGTFGLSFVIVSGDITESGDRTSLLKAKSALDKLKYKYYPLSGNHETKWSESGATDFAHIFGSERFFFEKNGIRFLGFGSGPIIRMMDGHVSPQDIKWLDEELAKNPSQPTIIVTHYPLTSSDVDNWYEVTDVLRKYNIKAIIGGHYHSNRLVFYDGIPAFICRSNLRDKTDGNGGYSIFEVRSDSILISEQKIGTAPRPWGGYSMTETYFTKYNSSYPRPDYADNAAYPHIKVKWATRNGNTIYAPPVVSNDKVYVVDDIGGVTCYSLEDGKQQWAFQTRNRIVGSPAVDKNILVVGSADKNIYGLDATTGKQLWKQPAAEPVLGATLIQNSVAYIGASDHTMRALDIKTGKLLWKYTDVKGYIETKPLIYANKLIFGAWDENLYALNLSTGKLEWIWSDGRKGMLYSPAAVWPVAAHQRVFITAPDRVLSAIDATTGKTIWRSAASRVRETVGLSADSSHIYSKTMQDSVVCYSALSDQPERLWVTNVGYGYDHAASMPIEKDGVVFGSTKNGIVFALDGVSGNLLWKHKIDNTLVNTVYPLSARECVFTTGSGLVGILRNEQ